MPAASVSKKRKASELDTSTDAAGKAKTPKKQSKGKRSSIASVDEIPFTSYCPVNANTKYRTKDVFVETKEIVPGYACDYAVAPGSRWKEMRSYRNVKYSEHMFTIGGIVYINNKSPPPPPPPENASDAEILAYDRTNFWVARIADTRAESDKAVYLRVFWLYWPEELPMGRQPYHSDRELIMSNAMEIVDAQTIASAADVSYWDENDMDAVWGERFWRQKLDIGKLGKDRQGGLSMLKKHCVCQQPYNPDIVMYQCKDAACSTWNHEACLLDDVAERAWAAHDDGTLENLDPKTTPSSASQITRPESEQNKSSTSGLLSTIGKFVHDKVSPVVHAVSDQAVTSKHESPTPQHGDNNDCSKIAPSSPPTKQSPTPQKKKSRLPTRPKLDPDENGIHPGSLTSTIVTHSKGKLQISLIEQDTALEDGPIIARVEGFTKPGDTLKKTKKTTAAEGSKTWSIPVTCLACKKAL